jgi:hypothetical protein
VVMNVPGISSDVQRDRFTISAPNPNVQARIL